MVVVLRVIACSQVEPRAGSRVLDDHPYSPLLLVEEEKGSWIINRFAILQLRCSKP